MKSAHLSIAVAVSAGVGVVALVLGYERFAYVASFAALFASMLTVEQRANDRIDAISRAVEALLERAIREDHQ